MGKELDSSYYHEAADRLHIILFTLNDHIQEHPAIKRDKDSFIYVQEAIDALAKAYQRMASKI